VDLAYDRLSDPALTNRGDTEWVNTYVICATVERRCEELLHRALGKQVIALYHMRDLARDYGGRFSLMLERKN